MFIHAISNFFKFFSARTFYAVNMCNPLALMRKGVVFLLNFFQILFAVGGAFVLARRINVNILVVGRVNLDTAFYIGGHLLSAFTH